MKISGTAASQNPAR